MAHIRVIGRCQSRLKSGQRHLLNLLLLLPAAGEGFPAFPWYHVLSEEELFRSRCWKSSWCNCQGKQKSLSSSWGKAGKSQAVRLLATAHRVQNHPVDGRAQNEPTSSLGIKKNPSSYCPIHLCSAMCTPVLAACLIPSYVIAVPLFVSSLLCQH